MQSAAEEISKINEDGNIAEFEKLLSIFTQKGGRITSNGIQVPFSLCTVATSAIDEIRGSKEGREFLGKIQAKLAASKLRML